MTSNLRPVGDLMTCQRCSGPHEFDTSVPSELWNTVVRPRGFDTLCLNCIVVLFVEAGVDLRATLWGDPPTPPSELFIAIAAEREQVVGS